MRTLATCALALAPCALAQNPVASPSLPQLSDPIVVEAGGEPIRVTTGHAAPFVVDFDGDGVEDLVVGQYDGGTARVYRNVGTNAAPRFDDFTWLEADGRPASVPPS